MTNDNAGSNNRVNKAQIATMNRILQRYGGSNGKPHDANQPIITQMGVISVATTATLEQAIDALLSQPARPIFIAMTNKEGVELVLATPASADIGVMDSKGDIVRESGTLD